MKRAMVLALCLMLMAGNAYAKKDPFFVYDADEHDYEGRVVWSSDVTYRDNEGNDHDAFIWHTLNLKTGKYTTDEMRDSYIIMDDGSCEGFLTAREKDGCVSVFNVTDGYNSKLLFAYAPEDGALLNEYLRITVRAYMEDYLYYLERRAVDPQISPTRYERRFIRSDMHGDTYTYTAKNAGVLYKNGTCAWEIEGESALCVESPDRGVFKTLTAQEVDGAERVRPAVWLSEKKLLFWAFKPGKLEGTLYLLNIETGKVKKYLDKRGEEITNAGGYEPYSVMMDINEEKELVVYMQDPADEVYCEPILWDLESGKCTELYGTYMRDYGLRYRKKIREVTSDDMIVVWIKD
jgi:hypothetical protein